MADSVPARLTPAEGRRFGLAVGGAFLAIAILARWRGAPSVALGAALAGAVLVIAGLAAPGRLRIIKRAWTAFGLAVSKVTTPVILGVAYFLVFSPFGLVMRLAGRNSLVRSGAGSHWIRRGSATRSDLRRQF